MVVTCSDPALAGVLTVVKRILLLIQIIAPILLIIAASVKLTHMVKNPDDKKKTKIIINSFIAALVIFLIPVIVNVLMLALGENTNISSCWNNAKDVIEYSEGYIEVDEDKNDPVKVIENSDDYEKGELRGSLAIAKLAVRVAPIATPDPTKVYAPANIHIDEVSERCGSYYTPNPWHPPSQVDARYKDFEKIMDAVMNNSSRPGNKAYGSCAQAAAGIIRAVADPGFETLDPSAQIKYMANNTDKWTLVFQVKAGENLDHVCKPGDVLITETGWTHTMIYVGHDLVKAKFPNSNGNIFQAGYDECDHARYPRIDYIGVTPVPFNVYRPTGKGNFKYSFIDVEKVLSS